METQDTLHRHKFEYWNKNVFETFNFYFWGKTPNDANFRKKTFN